MEIGTKCLQEGWKPANGEARQVPICQSTTFKYDSSEEMGQLFDLEKDGYFYSRLANPTCDAVAAKICALEGGEAGILTASGMAANFLAVFNICEAGDHILASSAVYGGTFNLFGTTMKKMGIDCTFFDQKDPVEKIEQYFRPNTKCVFGETITNPTVSVFDIEKFADMAHRHGGGCIVDSGNFDWMAHADKYPGLTTPDESYHGIVYAQRFGKKAYITKIDAQLMRDLGPCQSPQNAFYLNLGLESLEVRMQRHCRNALAVAEYLQANEKVAWVRFSDLPQDPCHELQQKYLPNGSCGVLSFGLKGGRAKAIPFMDSLKLISIVTHVADSRTCLLNPASHTHRQMTDEQLLAAGIAPDLIRLSVGLENVKDIIADLAQALDKI